MNFRLVMFGWLLGTVLAGAPKSNEEPPQGPPVILPTFVVTGHTIPTRWLEVSWVSDNPLPFCPIKRAWISKVGWGTPAAEIGIRKGDRLLALDGREIGQMTGEMLHEELRRGRDPGSRLELVIQTPGQEKRSVAILFEKPQT